MPHPMNHQAGPDDDILAGGIAAGSIVLTMDGALPVEFLSPGDRVITRAGARELHSVSARMLAGHPYRIAPGALGHDRPDGAVLMAPGQRVLIRDWRARALYGQDQALVPIERLADGAYVAQARDITGLRIFTLAFGAPAIFYADGLELAAAVRVTATV